LFNLLYAIRKKMRVLNIHKRTINQPKAKISELLETLSTEKDNLWPTDQWPAMKLDEGLAIGSKGGHGPIRYSVNKYSPGELVQFEFRKPKGFIGVHRFEVIGLENDKAEISHTIEMNTTGIGTLTWTIAVRWLHDALMEDAFDKVENQFSTEKKKTKWNIWVKVLRDMSKPGKQTHSSK